MWFRRTPATRIAGVGEGEGNDYIENESGIQKTTGVFMSKL
jgi:hypothetical protein